MVGEDDAFFFRRFERAFEVAAVLTEIFNMYVAPEESMIRKEGRGHAQLFVFIQLIGAHELRMDDHGPAVDAGGMKHLFCILHRCDIHVDGGVAVAMDKGLDIIPEAFQDGFIELGLGDGGYAAAVVQRAPGNVGEIRFREKGGLALRRAVRDELKAFQLQMVVVCAEFDGRVGQEGIETRIGRQGDDVEIERACCRSLAQEPDCIQGSAAFLCGGNAAAGIEGLLVFEELQLFIEAHRTVVARSSFQQGRGAFLEKTGGFGGSRFANDDATGRVGGIAVYAGSFQRGGIGYQHMAGDMRNDNRIIGKGGVEVFFGRVASFRQLFLVIAIAGDPVPIRYIFHVLELFQLIDQLGDIVNVADGRWIEIYGPGACEAHEVAVSVHEARDHGMAPEVDDGSFIIFILQDPGCRADGYDLAVLHRYGVRDGIGRIHRDDLSIDKDLVGGRGRRHVTEREEEEDDAACKEDGAYFHVEMI